MPHLDDTDLEILSLLAEDARRPYAEIAEQVGLSGPAVSQRVTRLRESGVVRRFTVDVDRSQLRAGVPVLVRVAGATDPLALRDAVAADEAVEHTFVTVEGTLTIFARAPRDAVRDWLDGLLSDVPDGETLSTEVSLVDEADWHPSVEGTAFALTCAECENTVDSEGESATLGGRRYHFCCPSCMEKFVERYDDLEAGA
ncbi:MAG: AsnC family transcriptional regulator [Halobacteriaceae archaeon]